MSFIPHNAVLITSSHSHTMDKVAAYCQANSIEILGPSAPVTNSSMTIVALTSGSKFGWNEYNDHLRKLQNLRSWLSDNYEQIGFPDVIAVHYGESALDRTAGVGFFGEPREEDNVKA